MSKSYTVAVIFEAVDKVTNAVTGITRSLRVLGVEQKNVDRAARGMGQVLGGMGQTLRGVGQVAVGAARGVGQVAGAIWRAIPGSQAVSRAFQRAGDAIRYGFLPAAGRAAAGMARNAASFVANLGPVRAATQAISAFGQRVGNVVGPVLGRGINSMVSFGRAAAGMAAPILTGLGNIAGGLARVGGGLVNMARGVLGGVGNVLGTVGSTITRGIGGAIQGAMPHIRTLGNVAIGAFGAVGLAVAGAGFAIAGFTQEAARVSEMGAVLNLMGERAGWSASEIQENVSAMTDLGIRTDVAQGVLTQFARQQLDVADATMAARVAQDLAVLSGRDSSEVLNELIYGVRTQNSGLQVMSDLGIQTGAAMEVFAAGLGKSVEQLTATERQQAMLNAVQEAGINIAGTYDTAMQEPGKALRSLSRHFYEARVAIGTAFLPAMGNVVGLLTAGVTWVRGMLEAGQPLNRLFAAMGTILMLLTGNMGGFNGVVEILTAGITWLAERVEGVAAVMERFFGLVGQGVAPLDALWVVLREMGAGTFADKLVAFVEAIPGLIAGAAEVLGPIAAWLGENVKLQDVLMGLGAAILFVASGTIGVLIAAIAPVIGVFLAVVAIVALLRAAWESNFLGIQDIAAAVSAWLQTNVPLAFQAISDFVTGTFLPALQAAWTFVQANVIPVFAALGEVLSAVVGVAVTALAGLWQNVLQPALQEVGDWISSNLGPILEDFGGWLQTVSDGVGGVSGALSTAVGWLKDLASSISGISLPAWLTPGSPTPFEMGLRGIGRAARMLSRTEIPQLGGALAQMPERGAMAGMNGSNASVDARQEIGEINLYGTGDDETLMNRLAWKLRRQRAYGGA